ncbi:type II secretion system ATPase GspE [Candidatus Dependentiae bacterium]|jgi:general secretion pathway protein E|nr:type II secretion system ATPase GspE [Candidatus Dependentiae bacterium]
MLRKKIGEILIDLNVLTPQQLQESLDEQKGSGKLLGQILLAHKIISKEDLARALAQQVTLIFIERITEQMADPALLGKVPLKFLRQHVVIPIVYEGYNTIVTSNPRDLQPLDDLALLMGGVVNYAVSTDVIINDAINKYYPLETSKEMMDELKEGEDKELELGAEPLEEKDIMEMANDAPIVKLVNHVIFQAAKEGASDIHIEPFEKELRIRYRIDGNMYQRVIPPKRYQSAIVSRIKIMSHLNIAEKRIPQDGRIQLKVADKPFDIRVSILPSNFGERVVMRLLDKTKGIVDLEKLNMSERDFQLLSRTVHRPNGIVLVSGPTGSGKTTTLYSILNKLNEPDVNIITVEDPVEYTMSGISQVQVHEKVGLTFATALRSILRQDPDVVLIGEIRDKETAQIATQASLTGHLVLSTIHTNSAPATITRLLDMGIEPFLIASTLVCVISQRLVRRLCSKCKAPYEPTKEMLGRIGLTPVTAQGVTFYQPVGCEECLKTGYRGRLPVFEIMEVNDKVGRLIVQRVDASVIAQEALADGMTSLGADGVRNIKAGLTSIEEVLSVAYVEEPLEA